MTTNRRRLKSTVVAPTVNKTLWNPMSVTWLEKYDKFLTRLWDKLPISFSKLLATIAVFIVGISVNGSWVSIFVHSGRQLGYLNHTIPLDTFQWTNVTLESLKLNNFSYFLFGSLVVSYGMFFIIGGFLHWYYYVRQRDRAAEWKCQPTKWLSPELERHEIIFGSSSLFINAFLSSMLSCYISNGGYSTFYYKIEDYGWLWFFLQIPVVFIYQDYMTYWLHRLYHIPFLYKNFHKMHHKYKQPTAFSVTAIHPVESVHIQLTLVLPIFLIPLHWGPFYFVALYSYYHGIIDHSGINFKAYWWQPWQPDAIFHDNHHQYFHVNFAFNIQLWDQIHGTMRRKDRMYTEATFYGTGKALTELTQEELKQDIEERNSENPLAYRNNKLEYQISNKELNDLSNVHR